LKNETNIDKLILLLDY